MKFYLHAFCLDEDKAQPGAEELLVGPFDWLQITWDFVRAGLEDSDEGEDHQFLRDESGFWYPVAYIKRDETSGNMDCDYERGRFSDIGMVPFENFDFHLSGITRVPNAVREVDDTLGKAMLAVAKEKERLWMEGGED
jgi:hypothetical protein